MAQKAQADMEKLQQETQAKVDAANAAIEKAKADSANAFADFEKKKAELNAVVEKSNDAIKNADKSYRAQMDLLKATN